LGIYPNLWGFRRFGLAVFRASHLVRLQLTDFLTPAMIGPLGHADLTRRIGDVLTLRDENVNLAQFPGNLFGLLFFPRRV
jgi:hypothetical protein